MKHTIEVIYNDDILLAVNKPSGITVIPDRQGKNVALHQLLEKQYGRLFVVHRIDRGTSGLVCFAKNEEAHRHLSLQFQNHQVQKKYKAFVKGQVPVKHGLIESPIIENPSRPGSMMVGKKGKDAITEYKVEEEFKHVTLLEVEIKTGKTHQIRVHLASLGYPLLVDELYGNTPAFYFSSIKKGYKLTAEEERPTIARLTLHAAELTVAHLLTGNPLHLTAPLPKDLETVLKLLRKYDS